MARRKHSVACICGSTRFRSQVTKVNRDLTLSGYIVLAPGVFAHDGDAVSDAEKFMLDALHLEKIEMAELVFVVNPEGYMGASTWNEICHAKMLGKEVRFLVSVPDNVVDGACRSRLEYAERLAWESLDGIRHLGVTHADEVMYPSIRKGGFRYFDPWVTADAHYDAWSFHDDPQRAQDPFEVFGRKRMARFVAEILAARGCAEDWAPVAGADWGKHG